MNTLPQYLIKSDKRGTAENDVFYAVCAEGIRGSSGNLVIDSIGRPPEPPESEKKKVSEPRITTPARISSNLSVSQSVSQALVLQFGGRA